MTDQEIEACRHIPCFRCGHRMDEHRWDLVLGIQECNICFAKDIGNYCTAYMSKPKLTVEVDPALVPEGWEAVAFRCPSAGESWLGHEQTMSHAPKVFTVGDRGQYDPCHPVLIVRPKRKRQWIVEECDKGAGEGSAIGGGDMWLPIGDERRRQTPVRIVREILPFEIPTPMLLAALDALPSEGLLTVGHLAALEKLRRLLILFSTPPSTPAAP